MYMLRSDHAKTMLDKEKHIIEIKAEKTKLEEKLEARDSEIIRLKGLTGGLEVQELKVELAQVKVRLEERDKELGKTKLEADTQLNDVKTQLKEWIDMAARLVNGRADFEEWKKQFQRMSAANSVAPSLNQSLINSQENDTSPLIQTELEHSDVEMDDMNEQKESPQYFQLPQRKQLFGFQNTGLTCYAGAALQCVQVLEYYLTGQLLFEKSPHQPRLRNFYENNFQFQNVYAQNDSCEAFFELIQRKLWKSKLEFKLVRWTVCQKCKKETTTDEIADCIQLECVGKSLEYCMAHFFNSELLEGAESFACKHCSEKTNADTRLSLVSTSDIIVVNLKRQLYSGSILKNNDIITVPFRMKIESCCYELIAFVLHCDSKTASTGHYKAYINCNTEWCEFDDDRMRVVGQKQLETLANQGYYYCYRRLNESQQRGLPANLTDLIEAVRPSVVHCSLCNSDFEHSGAKFQHWKDCQGLKQANERVADRYNVFAQTASEKEKELIQTVLGIEGGAVKSAISKINLIQQRGSADFKKKFVNDLDLINLARLHDELHDPKYFNALVHHTIVGPVADAEGNRVYAQNSTREMLIGMLGKTNSRKSTSSLEKEVVIKMKKTAGIALTLDERRSLEADDIKLILQKHENDVMHIRDYLEGFSDMRSRTPFKKVNPTFCDGMILPRLEQLFKTYNDFQAAFHSAGIQVQKICPGQKEGFVYVRLQDSANEFDTEFVLKLNALIQSLRRQLEELNEDREVVDACFVQQIDCTQDMKGFFLSFDVKVDIGQLSELMNMERTHDYPTFESLFTLLQKKDYGTEEEPSMLKSTRFKIYNKLLHFLESEQGKKKISMNLKGLLNCSSEFYQKLRESFEFGLSRLEFSHYFYSFGESQKIDVENYQLQIDNAFDKVNELPQIRYEVPFKTFFDRFFNCSKPVFIFQNDSWTIVYAKHSISAYIGQNVKITKGRFNTKDKIDCIKRFGVPGKWCTVIDEACEKVHKVMKTGSKFMQIPIQSLNTSHFKAYDFPFEETIYKYFMSTEEVNEVKLVEENGIQFIFEEIAVISSGCKRDKKSREKEEKSKGAIDITKLLESKKNPHRHLIFNKAGQNIYGSICKFVSKDKGVSYQCDSCNRTVKSEGRSKQIKILFD